MTIDTSKITANWKTTTQGLLSLAIALVTAYLAIPVGAKTAVIVVALLKAALAFVQKDA
ncbi:hypothetical protein [Edaphobacter modestus]|uniref:Uncharacterized protein n=1 Tax=Edaphobacter modestus TaxID=388466 RepID=A0A4V2G442_9BACT|nr:hypothetical protein [Edaphobacter modestus]RZU39336.1 hypothetical protein BDD14_0705 [Edaphobacter modestus]